MVIALIVHLVLPPGDELLNEGVFMTLIFHLEPCDIELLNEEALTIHTYNWQYTLHY